MASLSQVRKKVEDKIISTMELIEPGKVNSQKYRDMFKAMSDKDFISYFKNMKNDEDNNFYLEVDLYGKNNVTLKDIKRAADYLKLPLEETVTYYHKSSDGNGIKTQYKVPVFPIHMKRLQHILSKKVRVHTDIAGPGVRSKLTGTLNSSSRTGRFSDADTIALISVCDLNDKESIDKNGKSNLSKSSIVKELLSARADNSQAKIDMNNQISVFGYAKQEDFTGDVINTSQAVNTLDVFLLGAGLKSDIITNGTILKSKVTEVKKAK